MQLDETQPVTTALMPQRSGAVSAAAETDSQRAIAEVQAQMILAKKFPRNEIQARDKILNACQRPGLAKVAMYSYSRGGTEITGPSIRLAEVLVQAWGNIMPGWRELSRNNGSSEVEAYAWDVETNTRWALTFTVRHIRDKKSGNKVLTDERDIYELLANQAARRMRACILKLIPGDIVEEATEQCGKTLVTNINVTPERIKNMEKDFLEKYGITKEQIEKRIQRRMDTMTPAQMVALVKIWNSLNDGMSTPDDWFETIPEAPEAKNTKKKSDTKNPEHDPETGEIKATKEQDPAKPENNEEKPKPVTEKPHGNPPAQPQAESPQESTAGRKRFNTNFGE